LLRLFPASILPFSPSTRSEKESDFPPSMAGAGAGADDDVMEVSCGGGDGRDPGAYAAVLKRRLDLYCAAVAKSMVRFLLRQRFGVALVEFASSSPRFQGYEFYCKFYFLGNLTKEKESVASFEDLKKKS